MDGGFPGGREPSQRTLGGSGFTLTSPPPGKSIAYYMILTQDTQ